jgi:hypothetical protein
LTHQTDEHILQECEACESLQRGRTAQENSWVLTGSEDADTTGRVESRHELKDFWPPKSPPARCHALTEGQRSGQLSVDLDHPYRLIFIPDHDPIPMLDDGGLDCSQVTAIKILGVEDTHG